MDKRKILVVEVNWLGDVLFSTAAIRAIKNKYPDSYLACLLHKRCKEVLVGNPYVDEIIILDEEGEHRGFKGLIKLVRQLKVGKFDIVYLFHRSFTRTLACFLAGIKTRIGYFTAKRRCLLTESVSPPEGIFHRAAFYHYLVTRTLTNDKDILHSDFYVDDEDSAYVASVLEEEGLDKSAKVVVMHPSGNWPLKRWPKENFAQLADTLINEFGVSVVFSGAVKERDIIKDILDTMKNKAVSLCGRINLKQLGALLNKANIVISADSGPLHIAVALYRPTVALFGPTSIDVTGPLTKKDLILLKRGTDCAIPCYKEDCPDNVCMKNITPQDVAKAIEDKKWLTRKV